MKTVAAILFGSAALVALPVLMGSVLGSPLLALATAAGVTLVLLGDAWIASLHLATDSAASFLQAGLSGAGYFALAAVVNQLAGGKSARRA